MFSLVIVPEPFLVLFRPGTASVWSGLGTFFVPEPEHVICRTKSWCAAHGGRWGVVRERVRTADERRSVPNTWHLTTGCLKQSQLSPPNRPGDRPSINATANDPGLPRTGRPLSRRYPQVSRHASAMLRCWLPTKLSPHRCRRHRLEQGRCWAGKVQIKQCGIVTRSWSCHAVMFIASAGRHGGTHWLSIVWCSV